MKTRLNHLDLDDVKHDIQRLMKATSQVADEAVVAARSRLASSLEKAGEACGQGAGQAGKFVKGHACGTAVIALLAGIAAGYILSRNSD
jgi:ElaB/YqjD/DUF883 family membrane-anchored ribosome-binding protein